MTMYLSHDTPIERFVLSSLITTLCLLLALESRADNSKPDSSQAALTIEKLHDTLIATMKLKAQTQLSQRLKTLEPVIPEVFDLEGISKFSTGSTWEKESEAKKKAFLSALKTYTSASYATRFGDFKGEKFMTISHSLKGKYAVVKAEFTTAKGQIKKFIYQLRMADGEWRIINVYVNGVSDLATKRAEYGDIIKKKGFKALIDTLQRKKDDQIRGQSK